MEIIYSFEQYCPKCNRNITVEEKYTSDGKIKLLCTESTCEEDCRCISRLSQLLGGRKKF